MDKQLLERVSVVIQVLGYGLFIHSIFVYDPFDYRTSFQLWNWAATQSNDSYYEIVFRNMRDGQLLYLITCLFAPIVLRWMLTGNFHIIPLTHNYLKEIPKVIPDKSEDK